MSRISSRLTFFYKRIFPLIFFATLLAIFVMACRVMLNRGGPPSGYLMLAPIIFIGVLGYYQMRTMVFDVADEVFDSGDSLVIRNAGREDRIALGDIMNVSYAPFIKSPRVTLLLRRPSIFGDHVTFIVPAGFVPFAANPLIEALIHRIDADRRAATTH